MAKNTSHESRLCPKCGGSLLPSKFGKGQTYCSNYRAGCKYKGKTAFVKANIEVGAISPLKTASVEQANIFTRAALFTTAACMMMIKALAGTGKTTVLIQLVRIFAQELSKTVLCVAFAKRDKLALEERAKGQATVKTSNLA
jgi:hypothetical protein